MATWKHDPVLTNDLPDSDFTTKKKTIDNNSGSKL